ncbi:MAG: ribonuclease HI family protein [Nanoarchaeota archaeon]|nr:ribonuclease HI family protein [Nanoarchaeota archaeon]
MGKITIFTDGGARGNPGPAAIGAVVDGKEYAETIGKTTNNVAEYKAVIMALKKAKELVGKESEKTKIEIRSDSELLVKQQNGEYKIKEESLKKLSAKIRDLKQDFKEVFFIAIRREKNREADKLVNRALDKKSLF